MNESGGECLNHNFLRYSFKTAFENGIFTYAELKKFAQTVDKYKRNSNFKSQLRLIYMELTKLSLDRCMNKK